MTPRDSLAKEEIRKLIGYLHDNRERIHYRGDRIGWLSYWERQHWICEQIHLSYTNEALRRMVG